MTVWYLEQRGPSHAGDVPSGRAHEGPPFRIERVVEPALPHYRWLFNRVGQPWNWFSRNQMNDLALAEIVHDPRVEVLHLKYGDAVVGFAELDRRVETEVELKFFGLFPDWTGCGLGRPLLSLVLNHAWSTQPRRVWLHTCSEDHPAALKLYLSLGFSIFDQQT
jgi:GNAT superfamily N-acetyltransferase